MLRFDIRPYHAILLSKSLKKQDLRTCDEFSGF